MRRDVSQRHRRPKDDAFASAVRLRRGERELKKTRVDTFLRKFR